MAKPNNQYEAMFLLPAGGDIDAAIKLCRSIIERHKGEILVIKKWDERKMTFEIKQHKRGLYVIAFYKGPGEAVHSIERDVNLSEDVLRVMVLKADHLSLKEMESVEPQPIQVREERPEGAGFGYGGFEGGRNFDGPRGPRGPRREEGAAAE